MGSSMPTVALRFMTISFGLFTVCSYVTILTCENTSVSGNAFFVLNQKLPFSSVMVPSLVPLIITVTLFINSGSSELTLPFKVLVWANEPTVSTHAKRVRSVFILLVLMVNSLHFMIDGSCQQSFMEVLSI